MEYIMPCIYAFIACLGFAITYNIRWQRMIPVCFGGALGWVVYLLLIILLLEVDEQDIYSLHMMISVKLYCPKK